MRSASSRILPKKVLFKNPLLPAEASLARNHMDEIIARGSKKNVGSRSEIRTRICGFKVQCANRYTNQPAYTFHKGTSNLSRFGSDRIIARNCCMI